MTSTIDSAGFARLIGPTLLALPSTESINAHIWALSTAPTIFLNGSVIFVSGLAIIQNHNVWCYRWPVLITLIGWGNLVLGLLRMACPELMLKQVRRIGVEVVKVLGALMSLLGGFLTFKGYFEGV
jgi:hypothetical protein